MMHEAGQDGAEQERKDARQAGRKEGDRKKGHFLCEDRNPPKAAPLLRSTCRQNLDLRPKLLHSP